MAAAAAYVVLVFGTTRARASVTEWCHVGAVCVEHLGLGECFVNTLPAYT